MGKEGLYLHIVGGFSVTYVSNRGICLQGNDPGYRSFHSKPRISVHPNVRRVSAHELKRKNGVFIQQRILEEGKVVEM